MAVVEENAGPYRGPWHPPNGIPNFAVGMNYCRDNGDFICFLDGLNFLAVSGVRPNTLRNAFDWPEGAEFGSVLDHEGNYFGTVSAPRVNGRWTFVHMFRQHPAQLQRLLAGRAVLKIDVVFEIAIRGEIIASGRAASEVVVPSAPPLTLSAYEEGFRNGARDPVMISTAGLGYIGAMAGFHSIDILEIDPSSAFLLRAAGIEAIPLMLKNPVLPIVFGRVDPAEPAVAYPAVAYPAVVNPYG